MNSCHEEGVRDRNGAGTEAADPALTPCPFPLGGEGGVSHSYSPLVRLPRATLRGTDPDKTMRECP
eukprot:gene26282-biopygen15545